jgi:hypothetical protein
MAAVKPAWLGNVFRAGWYAPALRVGRQHDHSLGADHAFDGDEVLNERLERGGVVGLDREHEGLGSRAVVDFQDVLDGVEGSADLVDKGVFLGADADERGDVFAQLASVEPGNAAGDDPSVFELANAFDDGGGRQADTLAEDGKGGPAILLQCVEQADADGVELYGLLAESHELALS